MQPELLAIIPTVIGIYHEETGNPHFEVVINAGQEWHNGHNLRSLHHTGYAVDFQTIKLLGGGLGAVAQAIAARVEAALGNKYRVELEKHPPHLHVELRQGVKATNPGDFERSGAHA